MLCPMEPGGGHFGPSSFMLAKALAVDVGPQRGLTEPASPSASITGATPVGAGFGLVDGPPHDDAAGAELH